MKSIFTDKTVTPTEKDLQTAIGDTFTFWKRLAGFTKNIYPAAVEEWNFSGDKFGWSFRIKNKKRILIYLLPRGNFFMAAFVFGQKATEEILESAISESIKNEIKIAKVYAEGRGIRIAVTDKTIVQDIEKLIEIKVRN